MIYKLKVLSTLTLVSTFIRSLRYINHHYRVRKDIENDEANKSNTIYEIENSLKMRKKGQFLTENQSIWIHRAVTSKRKTEEEIISGYDISPSTLRRILKWKSFQNKDYDKLNIKSYPEWWSSKILINCIEMYLQSAVQPFCWYDLWAHIENELDIQIKPHIIRQLLQKRFRRSYKRGSGRPVRLDKKRHQWIDALFWAKLLRTLSSIKRIINIDGCWLSNAIKQNYSWLEKGKSGKINNTMFEGSMSILSAISSDGWSFTGLFHWTIDKTMFIKFLENLFRYLEMYDFHSINQTVFIMDNVPYQKTKWVKEVLLEWKANAIYIPPYSPELAPVELLFRSLKAKMKKVKWIKSVSIISQKGIDIVWKTLKSIKSRQILGFWTNFYREIKSNLEFIRQNA